MRYARFLTLCTLAALIGLRLAGAHEGHEHADGDVDAFAGGIVHPLTGLDHLLAMLAVGLWSAQPGGKSHWMFPAAFVGVMALGGLAGNVWGTTLALGGAFDHVIAASVLVLGLLLATAAKLPVYAGLPLIALFALAHGWAHGAEAPAGSFAAYGVGFALSTAMLHVTGLGLCTLCKENSQAFLPRLAGGAIAACGVFLLMH